MSTLLSAELAFPLALIAKATLLLAAAGLLSTALAWRRASAATRHLVWALAACALLVLPLFSVTLPGWRMDFLRLPAAESSLDVLPPAYVTGPAAAPAVEAVPEEAPRFAPSAPPASADESFATSGGGLEAGTAVAALYLLGVLALLGRLLLGRWGVRRLARGAAPLDDQEWGAQLRDLTWMLDVDRPVTLLRSGRATMPMTWGVRRPVVLLPDEAVEWPEERRRVVLLHELAHVARYDCLTQTLAAVACALYWFHPGAWYAARRLRVERELACDDRVLGAGTRAREYAAHLLEVARAFRPVGMAAPVSVSMARPSQLEGRLLAVLDGLRSRSTLSRSAALGAAAAALVLVLPLAAMRPGEARSEAAAPVAGKPTPLVRAPPVVQDGSDQQEIPARAGERLTLRLQGKVDVRVEMWGRNAVQVRSEASGPRDIRVTAERGAGGVRVVSRALRREGARGEVKMTVRVPRRFDVDVSTEGGGVEIHGVTGTFTGTTQGGGLAFNNARGTVRMTTEGGGAALINSQLRGTLRTEGGGTVLDNRGDLEIVGEGGPTIFTSEDGPSPQPSSYYDFSYTVQGDDSVISCVWPCIVLNRSGGRVILPEAPWGAWVSTGGGEIRIGPARTTVSASTGGGAITLESVDGAVRATTGAGAVSARLVGGGGDVDITTGSGTVTLILPADFSGNLDVESAYTQRHGPTQVISDFPLSITRTETWDSRRGTPRRYVRGRGRLGSGLHTVKIDAVNGNVLILRAGSRRATSAASTTRTPSASRTPSSTSSTTTTSTTIHSGDVDCDRDCTITIDGSGAVTGTGYTSTASTAGVGYTSSVGVGEGAGTGGGEGYAYAVGDEAGRALSVRRMVENAPPAAAAQGVGRIAFSDPSLRVQRAAVAALARLPEDHASPQLTRIARDHPSAEVRQAAREALQRY